MKLIKNPEQFHCWEHYAAELPVEYHQSLEEGLAIEPYKELFDAATKLPDGEFKEEIADAISKLVLELPIRDGYEYNEPSDLEGIKSLRNLELLKDSKPSVALEKKIEGAWYGRIAGCLLGKPVEGLWTKTLTALLKSSNNFPMTRYILSTDVNREELAKIGLDPWHLTSDWYIDKIRCAPADDDTNYTVMAQLMIERYGINFTPKNVLEAWMDYQPKNAYCTAERVAYMNFLKSYVPPYTAYHKNPYREWIGAQIRGDYYGYVANNAEVGAELAWRDASISHIKNGIYGEMLVSAMLAYAKSSENILDVIYAGLSQIPSTSRLYAQAMEMIDGYKNGMTKDEAFAKIHARYNNEFSNDWCHTISNALIVVASLLYGEGDFGKSICMAVETGFDTDCNGATVGSIVGMIYGIDNIGKEWTDPLGGVLETQILGHDKSTIDALVKKTLEHIQWFK
ncbi:MAG: ADP-ribosylglycohydrolase family protein [Clostridia bacterium]|nr:ADP-ribosylglycohydrolase family protein [Clostridia bacterium]